MNTRNRCQFVAGSLFLLTFAMGLGSSNFAARPQVPTKTIEVLVAKRDLHQHQRLTDPVELFTTATFRAGNVPVGTFASFDDLRGKVLRHSVAIGVPVLQQNIYETESNWKYSGSQVTWIPIEERNLPMRAEELSGRYVDIAFHYRKEDGSLAMVVLAKNAIIVEDSSLPPPMPDKTYRITIVVSNDHELLMIVGAKEMVGTFQFILSNR